MRTTVGTETDEALMRRVQDGDDGALARLVERYAPSIVNFMRRATGDRAWAEDLAQDVFAAVFQRAAAHDPAKPFRPWLYSLARHRAVDFLRHRGHEVAWRSRAVPSASAESPIEGLERREDVRRAEAALAALPEKLRTPLILCLLEGLSYEDAAAAMECPVNTIASRVSRGRERFRQLFRDAP